MAFNGSPWHCGPDIFRSPFDLPSFRNGRLASFGNNAHHLLHDFFPPSSTSTSTSSPLDPKFNVLQVVHRASDKLTSSVFCTPAQGFSAAAPVKAEAVYSEGRLRASCGVGQSPACPIALSAIYMPFYNPSSVYDLVSTASPTTTTTSSSLASSTSSSSSTFSFLSPSYLASLLPLEDLGTLGVFANVNLAPSGIPHPSPPSTSSPTASPMPHASAPFTTNVPGVGVGVAVDSPYLTGFVHALKPLGHGSNQLQQQQTDPILLMARGIFHVTENLHIGAEVGVSGHKRGNNREDQRAYTHGDEYDLDMLNIRIVYSGHVRNTRTFQPESYQACLSLEDRGRRVSISYYRHTSLRINTLPVSYWQNVAMGVELCKVTEVHPIQDVSHFVLVGGGLYQLDADRIVKGRIDSDGNLDIAVGSRMWTLESVFMPFTLLLTVGLNLWTFLPTLGFGITFGDERAWRRNAHPFNQLSYQ